MPPLKIGSQARSSTVFDYTWLTVFGYFIMEFGELERKRFGKNGAIDAKHCVLYISDHCIAPMKRRMLRIHTWRIDRCTPVAGVRLRATVLMSVSNRRAPGFRADIAQKAIKHSVCSRIV
jgi:hypothetical protein